MPKRQEGMHPPASGKVCARCGNNPDSYGDAIEFLATAGTAGMPGSWRRAFYTRLAERVIGAIIINKNLRESLTLSLAPEVEKYRQAKKPPMPKARND